MIKKILLIFVPWFLLSITVIIIWKSYKTSLGWGNEKTTITHNMIVEKIEAIGKLEVVKYYIKDIVEHTEVRQWWPDPKVVVLISGEVVGCVDLKKLDSASVRFSEGFIHIRLPDPEICYTKINHQESKVYHLENELFDQSGLVDKAYKLAEKQLYNSAMKMKLLEQTRSNAEALLKPMIENMSGKKVLFIR